MRPYLSVGWGLSVPLSRRRWLSGAVGATAVWVAPVAVAETTLVDRAILRFVAPETGGARAPHFIFERILAFEARLEALADPQRPANVPYLRTHVQSALERHIAETLLASLPVDPVPTTEAVTKQVSAARLILDEQVAGRQVVDQAAAAEGIGTAEQLALLGRRARASLYLDRMVAPMLQPSEAELRALHRGVVTPFRDQPFERIKQPLGRWYVAQRLKVAVAEYYQNVRSRVRVTYLIDRRS